MALPTPLIHLDRLLLVDNGEPNAIQLDHGWDIGDRLTAGLLHQRFDLIDALIVGTQPHLTLQGGTLLLAQVAQILRYSTSIKHLMITIVPSVIIVDIDCLICYDK